MSKWKQIKENRIQTFDEEIWLYDSANNVIVKVEVPRRPWTKLDPDFTHWHKVSKEFPDDAPSLNPDGSANVEIEARHAEAIEKMNAILRGTPFITPMISGS